MTGEIDYVRLCLRYRGVIPIFPVLGGRVEEEPKKR